MYADGILLDDTVSFFQSIVCVCVCECACVCVGGVIGGIYPFLCIIAF